ncbi:carboxylesterase family [Fusarium heterosporum]|uniref:Carboxylesterase family n=1 Tax=Fusarium heterosporum TaxID=42747 RepID=A0A8H5TMM6_FUSHE|nr:carboxylesterase family [Fusarium heterosporum]
MHLKLFLLASFTALPLVRGTTPSSTLILPWATYTPRVLAHDNNILLFENVRFGAKPVRFGASNFPTEPDGSTPEDTDCIQVNPSVLTNPPGGRHPLGDPFRGSGDLLAAPASNWSGTEDCLFLDVYVPRWVFETPDPKPLPVTVWFYGGAYAFGTKRMETDIGPGPLYNGRALLEATGHQTIFVVGNYRLGAFGWLAGSIMEKQGLPNAGLYDQNLILQWVQKYIGQVNGDNTTVSAWGESAGGGSILHHLIRDEGNTDPLFTRFVTQSPAFEWAWDNSPGGQMDQVYVNFSKSLKCKDPYPIDCIRNESISLEDLAQANVDLFETVPQTGLFPIGPSVDNAWVKTIPTLAFATNKYWSNISSSIVSHCANDAEHFTPTGVTSNATFFDFLESFLPGQNLTSVRTDIANMYDCEKHFGGDYNICLRHVIRDASFTCNTRDLLDAYPGQAYAMNYGFPDDNLALHASDLIPLFGNPSIPGEIALMIQKVLNCSDSDAVKLALQLRFTVLDKYLGYFGSFALYGNTDKNGAGDTGWPVVNGSANLFSNVIKPSSGGWSLVEDDQNAKDVCTFWRGVAQNLTSKSSTSGTDTEDVEWDEEEL